MTQQTTAGGALRAVLDTIAASRGLTLEAVADETRERGYPHTLEELAGGDRPGYGDALEAVLGLSEEEREKIIGAWWTEAASTVPGASGGRPEHPEGPHTPHERPDPGGCVLRGAAATGIRELSKFGNAPTCRAGVGDKAGFTVVDCARPAVMEVYGIEMCETHGEEAASGALEEIAHDLDQELPRPMNPHVRDVSPHIEAALRLGFGVLGDVDPEDGDREGASYRTLVEAFPLGSGKVCGSITAYAEDPDGNGRGIDEPPLDAYLQDRLMVHRHMRLAFEEGADWLVETLEPHRVHVAAQAAYALALEDSPRPGIGREGAPE